MESITPVPKTQIAASIVANEIGIATSPETAVKLGDFTMQHPPAYMAEKGIKVLPLILVGLVVWYFFLR